MNVKHHFGGGHTEIKLNIVTEYVQSYLTAMKNLSFRTLYVDAFAGSGSRDLEVEGDDNLLPGVIDQDSDCVSLPGSVKRVLALDPAFDSYYFIDAKASHVKALKELKAEHPDRNITCICGDANSELQKICGELKKTISPASNRSGHYGDRGVTFLDPYGMQVDWKTLQAIAKSQVMDLWFLFPSHGIARQLANNLDRVDESKKIALTRALGTDKWENDLYDISTDLLGDPVVTRTGDLNKLQKFVQERLSDLFKGKVFDPIPIQNSNKGGNFDLYFAISNPAPKAIGLATRLYDGVKAKTQGSKQQ